MQQFPHFQRIALAILLSVLCHLSVSAQRLQQPLDRGVVAVYRSGGRSVTSSGGTGYLISWRKLAQEPEGTTYNVYKRSAGASDFTKMNATPLQMTNYKPSSLTTNTEYAVTAISPSGVEGPMSKPFLYKTQPWPNVWLNIDFDNTVLRRNDYRTKFCWPMDTDGDGEYDAVVVDRLFASAVSDEAENTENTATTSHKIQAYRFTGELLWTVDMGPNVNICGGQNDMVVAWDINCDGRCEVMVRSSDGTRFWDKANNTWGKYAMGSDVPDVDGDGIVDYRTQAVRNRPFYISVIDGLTGEEIACSELKYEEVHDGSDHYTRTSRPNYMSDGYSAMDGHFAICYLDGIHPSLVMECLDRDNSKTHHNYVFTWDYDWSNGSPTNWHHSHTWSRNDKTPWPAEFHQLRVADVDGDGTDEMIQGGYSVNPHTGWFASPGIGHGDRFVLSDIDPDRPGLEVYAIQQSSLLGQLLYDARSAERIKEWHLPSVYDVGRGTCLDIDASRKGYEILSYVDDYVYDCKGERTGQTRTGSMFEGCWWDGDLQREWLNSPGGSGWGTNLMVSKVLGDRLAEFSQESNWATHAATGTRPAFMGDIMGDWREEVILAKQNDESCTGLVGYTTAMPTNYSIYCLQQDPHYRGDCTTRGYYQHPNTGFYLGGDMPMPPLPPVFEADLRWKRGSASKIGQGMDLDDGFTTFDMANTAPYADGKSILFDIYGDNSSRIWVDKPMDAPVIYLMNPRGHDYEMVSKHVWATNAILTTGSGSLIKSMQGKAALAGYLRHTGPTIISEGMLQVNGEIVGPVELRARGTLSGSVTLKDTITFEGALNHEGCRLMPGTEENLLDGVITSKKSMVLPGNVYLEIGAGFVCAGYDCFPVCSHLMVEGDLTFRGTNYITINYGGYDAAEYVIAECSGTLTCDVSKLKVRGLEGVNYDLVVKDKQLVLVINESRAPQLNVVWTGSESNVWNYKDMNFSIGQPTTFVSGDAVVFNAQSQQKNINVPEMMVTNGVTFDAGTYTLYGEGGISGEGGVTVNKDANVTLNMKYSDYTGRTIVNGGTLTVPNFYDGGQKSALGAATAAKDNLQLNGGTLVLSKENMGTNRQVTLTDTATIRITQSNSSLSLKGAVSGTGYLVKDGAGQLNLTYGGANNFAGLIVKRGVVAQGAWNATFGRSGSPMLLSGGEVHQIDVNSTSTVPVFNHVVTVAEGTSNKIVGSSRGKLNGSVKGKGALTIVSKYVRCDIGLDFKDYEGTLTASGSQWRLMSNVTDMSKATLKVDAATNIAHYSGGSGNQQAATLKIGAIAGTAADGVLEGQTTYRIGCLDKDMTFSGLFKGAGVIKEGKGRLTLRTAGSTSPITVNGGTLELSNTTTTAMTTGLISVASTGVVTGTATVQNLTLKKGATTLCQLNAYGNSCLTVKGNLRHDGDTILVVVPTTRQLQVGDEITVFKVTGSHTGSFIVKVDDGGVGYEFDSSTMLDDGKLRVTAIASTVDAIIAADDLVDIYTTNGICLHTRKPFAAARATLSPGTYIVVHGNASKKIRIE
ncbi:MAG: cellulosome protein [Prevotella sp.]|nr:cellulosome protein [Prevotella sp.]